MKTTVHCPSRKAEGQSFDSNSRTENYELISAGPPGLSSYGLGVFTPVPVCMQKRGTASQMEEASSLDNCVGTSIQISIYDTLLYNILLYNLDQNL